MPHRESCRPIPLLSVLLGAASRAAPSPSPLSRRPDRHLDCVRHRGRWASAGRARRATAPGPSLPTLVAQSPARGLRWGVCSSRIFLTAARLSRGSPMRLPWAAAPTPPRGWSAALPVQHSLCVGVHSR
ncbi:hypothetical protein TcCL_Unassigned03028 [Trypanosoma cruzi]|nr:hypothetical protein TcCL_Unassigned03028 [Trypanosoma cruzi]